MANRVGLGKAITEPEVAGGVRITLEGHSYCARSRFGSASAEQFLSGTGLENCVPPHCRRLRSRCLNPWLAKADIPNRTPFLQFPPSACERLTNALRLPLFWTVCADPTLQAVAHLILHREFIDACDQVLCVHELLD